MVACVVLAFLVELRDAPLLHAAQYVGAITVVAPVDLR